MIVAFRGQGSALPLHRQACRIFYQHDCSPALLGDRVLASFCRALRSRPLPVEVHSVQLVRVLEFLVLDGRLCQRGLVHNLLGAERSSRLLLEHFPMLAVIERILLTSLAVPFTAGAALLRELPGLLEQLALFALFLLASRRHPRNAQGLATSDWALRCALELAAASSWTVLGLQRFQVLP